MACAAKNARGEPCQANPLRGSEYCATHDPANKEKMTRARSKGGSNVKPIALHEVGEPPVTYERLREVVAESIQGVRCAELSAQQAEAVCKLAKVQMELIGRCIGDQPGRGRPGVRSKVGEQPTAEELTAQITKQAASLPS
jgi:hypothetical protein